MLEMFVHKFDVHAHLQVLKDVRKCVLQVDIDAHGYLQVFNNTHACLRFLRVRTNVYKCFRVRMCIHKCLRIMHLRLQVFKDVRVR